jgi:uncharacterized membrane protein
MRSLELIYLVAAGGLLVFLATGWAEMGNNPRIALIAGIVIATFMYSFRRMLRIKMEQAEREEEARNEREDPEHHV